MPDSAKKRFVLRRPKSRPSIGAAMIGGKAGKGRKRRKDDFYPTPPEATEALIRAVPHLAGQRIWENACGDGAIARVLESHGCKVVGTDLVYRGYGQGGVNFLSDARPRARVIITNPPFNRAQEFIEHAMRMHIEEMWMLLKTSYFQAARRQSLKARFCPTHKLELSWRLDCTGEENPTMEFAWFGWRRDHSGGTQWSVLPKPRMETLDIFVPTVRPLPVVESAAEQPANQGALF